MWEPSAATEVRSCGVSGAAVPTEEPDTVARSLGFTAATVAAAGSADPPAQLWPRYRLPDTINRETVTAAGLLRPAF